MNTQTATRILTSPPRQSVVLITRVVGEGCNLKCRYCWFRDHDQTSPKVMSSNVLRKVIKDASRLDQPSYSFVWLGGEPFLAGVDFFQQILEYQSEYMGNIPIQNRIQTNGMLLNSNWIKFLKNSSFKLGISLDGPKDLHNKYRVSPTGKGSFETVFRHLKKCREAKLKFGVIATITDSSVEQPSKVFDFFLENGIKSLGFNFVHEVEDGHILESSVAVSQYTDFLITIFDRWLEADDESFRIREIDNILTGLFGNRPKTCSFNGSCSSFFSIGLEGEVLPCERLSSKLSFGNIMDSDLQSCLQSSQYSEHREVLSVLPNNCNDCSWVNACHGGCTHYRNDNNPIFCAGNKRLFQHVVNKLA
jgi:uncharacterized protein